MATLDFDKMDDLELFVRHFRHEAAAIGARYHGHVSPDTLADALTAAIDNAWAEVEHRRDARANDWLKRHGMGDLSWPVGGNLESNLPAPNGLRLQARAHPKPGCWANGMLQWQPAAKNNKGWLEFVDIPEGEWAGRFIVCNGAPGLAGYVLKHVAPNGSGGSTTTILPGNPWGSVEGAKNNAQARIDDERKEASAS